MTSRFWLSALVSVSLLSACGGSRQSEPLVPIENSYEPRASGEHSRAKAARRTHDGFEARSSAPAPSAGADAEGRSFESAPADERPGLGTSWGETRASFVSSVSFEREDPDSPFSLLTVHYNDEEGVRAMARRTGGNFGAERVSAFNAGQGALVVRLLDGDGDPLPSLAINGSNYVVGDDGDRYVIQIRNNTGARVEAVTTVDGLDVIDGRPGSFAKRGYLIQPFSTVEIDGFRQSTDSVAAFRFGKVSESYAARKGDDRNVGVIGVAFFNEEGSEPWSTHEVHRRLDANPFPNRFAEPPL